MATAIIQLALASKLVKGIRQSPESFRRWMCCSTWAWARMVASRSTGSPSCVGVEAPVAELETREQAALGPGVEGLTSDDAAGCHRAACGR